LTSVFIRRQQKVIRKILQYFLSVLLTTLATAHYMVPVYNLFIDGGVTNQKHFWKKHNIQTGK